jgi:CRISPR-associated endonuclease/helicase Cas3
MCPAHRTEVLKTIREALRSGHECRAVSTQVVEAGVDLDFPVVLRALGPLDALAQAAGRCNREGLLIGEDGRPCRGLFEVYVAESSPPRTLRSATTVSQTVLKNRGRIALDEPNLFLDYFDRLYSITDLDAKHIQRDRAAFRYRTVGENFELIPDHTLPIVVPYGAAGDALERFRDALTRADGEREALRALQRYIVGIPRKAAGELIHAGAIDTVGDIVHVLRPDVVGASYDVRLGLVLGADDASEEFII